MLYRQQTRSHIMRFSIELDCEPGNPTSLPLSHYEYLASPSPQDPHIPGLQMLQINEPIKFDRFSQTGDIAPSQLSQ